MNEHIEGKENKERTDTGGQYCAGPIVARGANHRREKKRCPNQLRLAYCETDVRLAPTIEEHNNIRKRRIDPDSEITWEEYKSMKFTSHVIHEALRLANIAPLMFRKATEEVHIKGYTLPKGSKIMVNPSSIYLDPTVYKDPSVFNPWRWKDTTEPAGGSSKEFMAFGGGLRLCVGVDFAKLQMAIFLHCLVTKYR
ncbi:cytochrome P450 87A3-like [Triticum urartu]|nr:cytochrome P450 87A3-like [Triticum urartu]